MKNFKKISKYFAILMALMSIISGCRGSNKIIDPPKGACYYVSPAGNDNWSGTLVSANVGNTDGPFKTLEKAQVAMRLSGIKTTYLRTGTYNRTSTLELTSADNGETWSIYPGDAMNSAVFEGNCPGDFIDILGGSKITINGLTIKYFSTAIGIHGGPGLPINMPIKFGNSYETATGNTISNNIIIDGLLKGTNRDRAGIIVEGSAPNTTISHNVVQNTGFNGIGAWSLIAGDNISGLIITGNVVLNCMQKFEDGGAIYTLDRVYSSTNISITNNFIRDYGTFGNMGFGIYMDDLSSDQTVTGNIITGTGSHPFLYHGGKNNTVTGNIVDLGSSGDLPIFHGSAENGKMANNKFIGNIIISSYTTANPRYTPTSRGPWYGTFIDLTNPSLFSTAVLVQVQNNFYHNYSTGGESTGGGYVYVGNHDYSDSNPVKGDPQISGWTYQIATGSPVFSSPVNFTPIVGGWGPPGYVIPQTGTPPSCAH